MERALVIGATGFIGRHIVRALSRTDIEVAGMRRWDSDPAAVAALGVDTVVGDLLDEESLLEVLPGYNFVFMAAAPRPGADEWAYLRDSVTGMRNLLKVAREVDAERVVVTSCATTIAPPAKRSLATAEDVYLPGTAHSQIVEAQYAAEQECFREAADGLDLVILCPGVCIGDGAVLPARKLVADLEPSARVNLVGVEDVARAHLAAARRQYFGERVALGGENTTLGELYERLGASGAGVHRLGGYEVRLSAEASELRHLALFRAGLWLDSARAERELGFRPRSL